MRLVKTAVLEIAVEEEGPAEGRPVLLLHGWPDAPRGWRPVARRLHEGGWRTIVPALRGSGDTRFRSVDAPRDGRGVALAGDTLDLLDALGLHGVPVVGHDWGARRLHAGRDRPRTCRGDRGPRSSLPAAGNLLRSRRQNIRTGEAPPVRSRRSPARATNPGRATTPGLGASCLSSSSSVLTSHSRYNDALRLCHVLLGSKPGVVGVHSCLSPECVEG